MWIQLWEIFNLLSKKINKPSQTELKFAKFGLSSSNMRAKLGSGQNEYDLSFEKTKSKKLPS